MSIINVAVIALIAVVAHDSIRFALWSKKECEADGALSIEEARRHLRKLIVAHIGVFALSILYGIKQTFACMINWIDG